VAQGVPNDTGDVCADDCHHRPRQHLMDVLEDVAAAGHEGAGQREPRQESEHREDRDRRAGVVTDVLFPLTAQGAFEVGEHLGGAERKRAKPRVAGADETPDHSQGDHEHDGAAQQHVPRKCRAFIVGEGREGERG